MLWAKILEWVAISYSRGSFWPRDQTWVSSTGGRFFTIWATREFLIGRLGHFCRLRKLRGMCRYKIWGWGLIQLFLFLISGSHFTLTKLWDQLSDNYIYLSIYVLKYFFTLDHFLSLYLNFFTVFFLFFHVLLSWPWGMWIPAPCPGFEPSLPSLEG